MEQLNDLFKTFGDAYKEAQEITKELEKEQWKDYDKN